MLVSYLRSLASQRLSRQHSLLPVASQIIQGMLFSSGNSTDSDSDSDDKKKQKPPARPPRVPQPEWREKKSDPRSQGFESRRAPVEPLTTGAESILTLMRREESLEGLKMKLEEEFKARIEKYKAEHGTAPADDATIEQEVGLRMMKDALDMYFHQVALHPQFSKDLKPEEKADLLAFRDFLNDWLTDGTPQLNIAPPGRLPWHVLGVDEESATVHWAVDLTEGRAPDPWKNARLMPEVKTTMYELHKSNPEKYDADVIARMFKIRKQRALAILALKELEEKERAAGQPLQDEFADLMDYQIHGYCQEVIGSGERHVEIIPSFPNYQERDGQQVLKRLEAKLGKSIELIDPEKDLTPELAREVLSLTTREEAEEILARKKDALQVSNFEKKLDFNMGRTGTSISRQSRRGSAPPKPKEGWSFVVKPLGKKSTEKAYVAGPSGERRELNADEKLLLERQEPSSKYI